VTVPGREGEFWAIANGALFHSTNSGASVVVSPNVEAHLVGFGKEAPGHKSPAVFIVAQVSGVEGIFRSDNDGASWVRISDERHGFGEMRAITGDPRVYGRVYLGTGGRGIVYGDIAR
jgi:hypothetical protein